MDVDTLFIRTLDDLSTRLASDDEYTLLMAAPLLRKLLLDSDSLLNQVNRSRRLKIMFKINSKSPYDTALAKLGAPFFSSEEDAIDPELDLPPGMRNEMQVKLDGLLKREVLMISGDTVTIRDLIDQLANIEGGVHSGKPDDKQKVLQAVSQRIYIGGLPAGVRQVRAIIRIVLRGLAPVRAAVEAGTGEVPAPT